MRKKNLVKTPAKKKAEDVIEKLSQKLATLENQIHDRDAKLDMLASKDKNSDMGSQRFGVSDWKDWENGAEKGYFRSMYVDIRTLVTPRAI